MTDQNTRPTPSSDVDAARKEFVDHVETWPVSGPYLGRDDADSLFDEAAAALSRLSALPAQVEVTEEMVERFGEMLRTWLPGHGWTGFGPHPDVIEDFLKSALPALTAALTATDAKPVVPATEFEQFSLLVDDVLDMALYLHDCPKDRIEHHQNAANRLAQYRNRLAGQVKPVVPAEPTEKPCALCGGEHDNDLSSDICVSCEEEAPWRELAPSYPAVVPMAGWKLVPVEPTPEMVGAFWRQKNTGTQEPGQRGNQTSDYDAYRAMLAASPAPPSPVEGEVAAARDVLAERERQKAVEGWTLEHDDKHRDGELIRAAKAYFAHATGRASSLSSGERAGIPFGFPWDAKYWKPKDPRRDLVRAGALAIAEKERIHRRFREDTANRHDIEAEAYLNLIIAEIKHLDRAALKEGEVERKALILEKLLSARDIWADYGSGFRMHFSFDVGHDSSIVADLNDLRAALASEGKTDA